MKTWFHAKVHTAACWLVPLTANHIVRAFPAVANHCDGFIAKMQALHLICLPLWSLIPNRRRTVCDWDYWQTDHYWHRTSITIRYGLPCWSPCWQVLPMALHLTKADYTIWNDSSYKEDIGEARHWFARVMLVLLCLIMWMGFFSFPSFQVQKSYTWDFGHQQNTRWSVLGSSSWGSRNSLMRPTFV